MLLKNEFYETDGLDFTDEAIREIGLILDFNEKKLKEIKEKIMFGFSAINQITSQ